MLFFHHNGLHELMVGGCETDLEVAFDEDGHGYFYDQQMTGGACTRVSCDEGASGANPHRQLPWEVQLEEASGGSSQETLLMTMCTRGAASEEGFVGLSCQMRLTVTKVGHAFELSKLPASAGGDGGTQCINFGSVIEIYGHWITSPNEDHPDDIEVTHLP